MQTGLGETTVKVGDVEFLVSYATDTTQGGACRFCSCKKGVVSISNTITSIRDEGDKEIEIMDQRYACVSKEFSLIHFDGTPLCEKKECIEEWVRNKNKTK